MVYCRRSMGTFFLLLAAGILAASCSAGQNQTTTSATPTASANRPSGETQWATVVSEAKREGKVNLYSNVSQETISALTKAFKDKYGVQIEFTTAPTTDLTQKINSERRAGLNIYDMLISGPTIMSLKEDGVAAPIDKALVLPEVVDPQAWPEGRIPFLDKDKYVVMLTGGYISYLVVNSDQIKENEITSYQDMLKPQYKGKIVMDDPTISRSGSNWLAFVMKYGMGPDKGKTFLRQLAAQEPVLTRDYRQAAEWVAKGKTPIGIAISQTIITEFKRAGAPIGYIRVAEGGVVHPGESCVVISNKPEHPNATILLLNWLMTTEGQTIFAKASGRPGLRRGTPTEGLDPFSIAQPGSKAYYINVDFINYTLTDGLVIAKDIFGPLLK